MAAPPRRAQEVLAARLNALLHAKGLSARQLSKRSGVAHSTVLKLLDGDGNPELGTLFALLKALDLYSLEELLAPLGSALAREVEPTTI